MKLLRRFFVVLLLLGVVGLGGFHARVEHLMNRPVPASLPATQAEGADQYYFAYGTNMSTRYLYNARGVLPAHSEAGVLENHDVRFLAPGLNALEPAFAYLVKSEGQRAHGVLHRVSTTDLAKVKESEGALYEWAALPVRRADGQVVAAQTLLRLQGGDAGTPSRRYVQILLEGAREHGLPAAYQSQLQGMATVYVPLASELLGDALQATVMRRSGRCASLLQC